MKDILLVTGIHRSGTTWLSSIFDTRATHIINEPMNLGRVLKFKGPTINTWYQVLSEQEMQYLLLACRTNAVDMLGSISNITSIGRLALYIKLASQKLRSQSLVIKDPFILFNIHKLRNTNIKIIEVSKTSYELAESFKRANWRLNQTHFCLKSHINSINICVNELDILNDFYNYPAHYQALVLKWIRNLYFESYRDSLNVLEVKYTDLNDRKLSTFNDIQIYSGYQLNFQNFRSDKPRGPRFPNTETRYSSVKQLLTEIDLSDFNSKRSLLEVVEEMND